MSRFVPVAAIVAATLLLPSLAQGQTPGTLTASGIGEADVSPADRKDDASIRAAVEAANAKAIPLAMAEARKRAAALAAAAGLTLGPLVAVADTGGFAPYLTQGTFGNGHF